MSLSADPRPLPPYAPSNTGIEHRFGALDTPLEREVWSPSRLEAWLKCPRQAWVKQQLRADDDDGVSTEDVDVRIRGQVVHETEAAIFGVMGYRWVVKLPQAPSAPPRPDG